MVFQRQGAAAARNTPNKNKKGKQKKSFGSNFGSSFDMGSDGGEGDESMTMLKTPKGKQMKGKQSLSERKVSFAMPGNKTPGKTPSKTPNSMLKKPATPASKGKMTMKEFKGMPGSAQKRKLEQDDDDDEEDDDDDDDEADDLDLDISEDDLDDMDEDDDDDDDDEDEKPTAKKVTTPKVSKPVAPQKSAQDEGSDEDDDSDDDDEDDSDEVPQLNQQSNQKLSTPKNSNSAQDSDEEDSDEDDSDEVQQKPQQAKQNNKTPVKNALQQAKQNNKTPVKNAENTKMVVSNSPKKESGKSKVKHEQLDAAQNNAELQRRGERDSKMLYMGNLPKDVNVQDIKALSADILDCILPHSKSKAKKRSAFAFLQFASEEKAEENFKLLKNKKFRGQSINIDMVGEKSVHKKPEADLSRKFFNPKKLFVSGIPIDATIDKIAKFFPAAQQITYNASPIFRTATILFADPKDASESFDANKDISISGHRLTVLHSVVADSSTQRKQLKRMRHKNRNNAKRMKLEEPAKQEPDSEDSG